MAIASSSAPTSGRGRSQAGTPTRAPKLIGVGVDGTASGRDAVVLASLLGRATGAELLLIAVVEEPVVLLPGSPDVSWRNIQKQARTTLMSTRDSLAPEARIAVQTATVVSRALESVVRRQRRDLLVIGSGHHGEEGQVRLGQSAQELLSDLGCPLAIAPRGMRNFDEPRLDRIGVGFDDEPEARAAYELSASIAGAAGAELDLLGVVDDRVARGPRPARIVRGGDAVVECQVDELRTAALTAAEASGVSARVQVSPGAPSATLRSLAAGVDLLVIGSSRSGPAGRLSLGRTANAVSSGFPRPVMIVPRPVR